MMFRARAVVSNLNPKLLFQSLVDPALLPADFRERIAHYRCASGTFRMNVALSALPRFTCLPEAGDHMTAGIIMAPSLEYMDRAYHGPRASGWSKEPIVEMLIPSFVDDTLAPAGQHVASLFCQHVAPELPDGRSWDDASRHRRRSDDRHGRALRARIQSVGHRAHGADAARSRTNIRTRRRRHHAWRV